MIQEKEFIQELGAVPPLPDSLYDTITTRIKRRAVVTRSVLAAAAALVLALGSTMTYLFAPVKEMPVSQELVSELQTIHDYLNGNDLDQELQVYVVYYNEE
jgi:hypothetical protein